MPTTSSSGSETLAATLCSSRRTTSSTGSNDAVGGPTGSGGGATSAVPSRRWSALVGVQYVDWNRNRYPNVPYLVTGVQRAPWLFEGTDLRNGDRFGRYGIEIDARTAQSPRGTRVLAMIPNAFGPGKSAEMTYYETRRGAKVFAAGVLNFGGSALLPPSSRLLHNLWERLAKAESSAQRRSTMPYRRPSPTR